MSIFTITESSDPLGLRSDPGREAGVQRGGGRAETGPEGGAGVQGGGGGVPAVINMRHGIKGEGAEVLKNIGILIKVREVLRERRA